MAILLANYCIYHVIPFVASGLLDSCVFVNLGCNIVSIGVTSYKNNCIHSWLGAEVVSVLF